MNKEVRRLQLKLLKRFSHASGIFALSGGTALELFYLKHRFSRDLDFFSHQYEKKEIDRLIDIFSKCIGSKLILENEFTTEHHARVKFYVAQVKGVKFPFKVDFIEDVFFKKPKIKKFNNIPVYDVKNIYFQKIVAIAGTHLVKNGFGKEIPTGRREARDVYDVYCLSRNVLPLHIFLKKLPKEQQRGMVQWYRSFSRQELKLDVLDLDIYDKNFDSSLMISHLEEEIKRFIKEVAGEL